MERHIIDFHIHANIKGIGLLFFQISVLAKYHNFVKIFHSHLYVCFYLY